MEEFKWVLKIPNISYDFKFQSVYDLITEKDYDFFYCRFDNRKVPGLPSYDNLILEDIVDKFNFLPYWFNNIMDNRYSQEKIWSNLYMPYLKIHRMDEKGKCVRTFEVKKAVPYKIDIPENSIVDRFEIMHDGIEEIS